MQNKIQLKPVRHTRTYKSRMFEMVFCNKKDLLGLYNAINGTAYDNPDLLEINTLENAIYMSMQNDLSFIIDARLALYEHQSTYNPNLPLRFLMYVASLYSVMVENENLYGTKLIHLPTPRFVIFYNGIDEQPDRQELRLSDSFHVTDNSPALELTAVMLNINEGHNKALMSQCKTLRDYAKYVEMVRKYARVMDLEQAVDMAIDDCIKNDILAEFLRNNRAEAKNVSIFEYDEVKHMRQVREEGFDEARDIINRLNQLLAEQHRTEDIIKAAADAEYQRTLLKEFGLLSNVTRP